MRSIGLDDVLNAFRHHRGGHTLRLSIAALKGVQCSTPFGITEVGIGIHGALSSSSRVVCSTPFGITEVGIRDRASSTATAACAQRLSASQRWAFADHRLEIVTQLGAQRLSASQRWACPRSNATTCSQSACSTPFGITEVGIHRIVERLSAKRQCSTPFGITEVGIIATAGSRSCNRCVLNAFRHHRGGHYARACRCAAAARCSTPFGITEVGMRRRCRVHRAIAVCSTPFGITEVGIAWDHGHGLGHGLGAQRLSASQRWACHDAEPADLLGCAVLNAFRHHRGGHRQRPAREPVRNRMCSTPFGITEVGIVDTQSACEDDHGAQRLSASQRWASRPRDCPTAAARCAQRLSASQRWA